MTKNKTPNHHSYEALMRYARLLGFGDIHAKIDPATGLQAIIAIHNTQLGPAIGGCRFYQYKSYDAALKDVLRLAYMMTLKAAASDLPHGGAKAVIIKPAIVKDRRALFQSFGDFVHDMNGRYITAMDIGTTTQDMDVIAERTPHVIGAAGVDEIQGDPSPFTAKGIFRGIQAAVKFKLGRDDIGSMRVAVQGGGKVAYYLSQHLHSHGAKIIMCDIKEESTQKFVDELNAQIVPPEEIYDVDADIFSPCAIGGTINLDTINRIKAKIIAGGANNQLAHRKYGEVLRKKGILYAPDFVINAGGVIQAASTHDYHDINIAIKLTEQIYDRMIVLFERAKATNKPTSDIAELIAIEKLAEKKSDSMECI